MTGAPAATLFESDAFGELFGARRGRSARPRPDAERVALALALLDWLAEHQRRVDWASELHGRAFDDRGYWAAYDQTVRALSEHPEGERLKALLQQTDREVAQALCFIRPERVRNHAQLAARGACRALALGDALRREDFLAVCAPVDALRRDAGEEPLHRWR